MSGISIRRAEPPWSEQPVEPHQPQDALAAGGQAPMRQPGSHIAVAFAVKRGGREDRPDPLDEFGIRPPVRGPRLPGGGGMLN